MEAIVEAASLVLDRHGPDGLTTNRIAERAGVSIGSVYQYFPNKEAILVALALRERQAISTQIMMDLAGASPDSFEDITRRIIRAFVRAFSVRRRTKRVLILTLVRSGDARFNGQMMDQIGHLMMGAAQSFGLNTPLTPASVYVLTRSIMGVVRAAVVEDRDIIDDPVFEEELVSLALCYLTRRIVEPGLDG